MEITKREVIASIIIFAIMMIIGFMISDRITEWQNQENAKYRKAIQINNDTNQFKYGMDTSVGNAFIYGSLDTIDPVTYEEIGGSYMYVEKVREEYRRHTRTVTYTVNGKTRHRTEVYWSWDYAGSEDKQATKVKFCGIEFGIDKFNIPDSEYITTINAEWHVRYKYYGTKTSFEGTTFTKLYDSTISKSSEFYENRNIDEALKEATSNCSNIIFWIVWIILMMCAVFGFYYLDNRWLNT